MKRICLLVTLLIGVATPAWSAELFALSDVRVLGGPLKHAQDVNAEHLLKYDVDRLLAPFRREAGLKPRAQSYPNWESTGLDGHTAGHYLSALANQYAATGDKRFKSHMDHMVRELAACQKAIGNGYIGGVPGGKQMWEHIARGHIRASGFGLNDKWVPWYNVHKTFAGLRDAYVVGGNKQARAVLVELADWCVDLAKDLNDQQMQQMLITEFGGMNEVLADVAQITGEGKYLDLAKRFNHQVLLGPLSQKQDRLNGMHANTQVPKIIGFEQIAQMSGDERMHTAAQFFWETVVDTRTLAFGGNSIAEHFPSVDKSKEWVTHREGPETCNTYNMLRLTELLFERSPEPRYAHFYERALFNHILSSQHPEHGGYVYFTPARPQHYRVYSQPGECFWCCVGSGMENHTKYGQFIYAHDDNALYVNLFVDSQLDWKQQRVKVRQETRFPEADESTLKIKTDRPKRITLKLRQPEWTDAGRFTVSINGKPFNHASEPGSYVSIEREWKDGDTIKLVMPMQTYTEPMPSVPEYRAVFHGPLVLAAATSKKGLEGLVAGSERMDHIAHGPLVPLNESPVLVADAEALAAQIKPVDGKPLAFTAKGVIRPESFADIELIPFYQVHDARYMLYWRVVAPESYEKMLAELAAAEAERLALEQATVDRVSPGQQQPEVEHNFRGENTETGVWQDRHFRHANGWFSYDLNTRGEKDLALRVTYFGSDHRKFDILLNGKLLETVDMKAPKPGQFMDADYPIDAAMLKGLNKNKLTVRFQAHEGSMAGGIYDVRLLKPVDADRAE